MDIYTRVKEKSEQIEAELKRLGFWQNDPLPPESYVNMGAFGSNTMSFEQWLQFILISRIKDIVDTQGTLPSGSALGTYAIRVWGGHPDVGGLHTLLYELDRLVNNDSEGESSPGDPVEQPHEVSPSITNVVSIDDSTIPPVLNTLADLLPLYAGDDLEAQLQTFDTFLEFLNASVRPQISSMLRNAAAKTNEATSRQRIEEAAESVLRGGRAAAPYDHDEAMRKYREDHKNSFLNE